MKLSRRYFLGMGAALATLIRWPRATAEVAAPAGLSILQGMTDETSVQFSVVVPVADSYTVAVLAVGSLAALSPSVRLRTWGKSQYGVLSVKCEGLKLGETYTLQIFGSSGEMLDEREFAALDLSRRKVKLALLSCTLDFLHRKDVWKKFAVEKPELAFFVGDAAYCDRKSMTETVPLADPDMMWERWVATRNTVSFYFQKRLTPVLATWDDHDFGGNNWGADYPYIPEAKDIFETFFAQNARPALEVGPGVARKLSAFGCDFFLIDGRSFREKPDVAGNSLLGGVQEAWLGANLQRKSTWLMNGSVFFGAYGEFESFEGNYPEKFQELLALVQAKGSLAAFVSGDVHYSELMDIESAKLGYGTFELVTSSMHSITFPGIDGRFENFRRRASDSSHNFMIFEGEFGDDKMSGDVTCWGSSYDLFSGAVTANR